MGDQNLEFVTDINDNELINQVRQFTHLYDRSHQLFKDKSAIHNGWSTIAATLNSTPELCSRRWSNLRTRYTAELRKIKNVPSGSSGTTTPPWYLVDAMGFLNKYVHTRRTKGNVGKPKTSPKSFPSTSTSPWDSFSEILNQDEIRSDEEQNVEEGDDTFCEELRLPASTPSSSTPSRGRANETRDELPTLGDLRNELPKRKRKNQNENIPPSMVNAFNEISSYIESKKNKDSPGPRTTLDIFGEWIAENLKDIKSSAIQRETQKKIVDIVLEARNADDLEN